MPGNPDKTSEENVPWTSINLRPVGTQWRLNRVSLTSILLIYLLSKLVDTSDIAALRHNNIMTLSHMSVRKQRGRVV